MSLLEKHSVRYLMIAANSGGPSGKLLLTNEGKDFGEVIENHGYKLVATDPKYKDPVVQKYAIVPTNHYLFELR